MQTAGADSSDGYAVASVIQFLELRRYGRGAAQARDVHGTVGDPARGADLGGAAVRSAGVFGDPVCRRVRGGVRWEGGCALYRGHGGGGAEGMVGPVDRPG